MMEKSIRQQKSVTHERGNFAGRFFALCVAGVRRFIQEQPVDVWRLLLIATTAKVLLVIFALIAYQFGMFCDECRMTNGLLDQSAPRTFLSSFQTWDTQQYFTIASNGYSHVPRQENAFYPLFPALLAVGYIVTRNLFWSAVFIATVLSYAAVVAAYHAFRTIAATPGRSTERRNEIAAWSTLLLLSFPTGYTLHSIYTESLFVLIASGAIIAMRARAYNWVALCVLLLPLLRPQGIIAVAGLCAVALWWEHTWKDRVHTVFWLAVWGWTGVALYFLIMIAGTGDMFAGFYSQRFFGSDFGFYYFLHPIEWVRITFFTVKPELIHFTHSTISRALFVYSLIGLYFVWRIRETRPFGIFVLLLMAISALPGTLTSYPRYALVLLPMYPAFVLWCMHTIPTEKRRNLILTLWVICGLLAQCSLYFYHASNMWIA